MNFLQITSLMIVLAGAFGALNYFFLKLPSAIGILVVSLLASLVIVLVDLAVPALGIADVVRTTVTGIDFSEALLEGMLGLLLFAGALHVKLSDLKEQWRLVFLMATIGIALSTAVVGIGFSWITGMPLIIALVFGALISPTDPVAVLGVLREADLPKSLASRCLTMASATWSFWSLSALPSHTATTTMAAVLQAPPRCSSKKPWVVPCLALCSVGSPSA
jgi:CPA1 family monovalent cation:H+ antiporter